MAAARSSAIALSALRRRSNSVSVWSSAAFVSACSRHADDVGFPTSNGGAAASPLPGAVTGASSRAPLTVVLTGVAPRSSADGAHHRSGGVR
jgi:hypothetical protein